MIEIKHGLDLPITGQPEQVIADTREPSKVALLGDDYVGMKPGMEVRIADKVKLGQVLFSDKNMPAVRYTAPGAGEIVQINRGAKRVLQSVVIQLSGNEEITFASHSESSLDTLNRDDVISQLLDSGLWTSLRTRPFSKVANPETRPNSIFITAIDTNPLAPTTHVLLQGREREFSSGMNVISTLTDGTLYLCKDHATDVPNPGIDRLVIEVFSGPHPAGNVGTHIHMLDPVHRNKVVWHIGLQDVIAVGVLFTTGRLSVDRVVSLAGPMAKQPRLIKTRIGASMDEILRDEINDGDNRIISGSVLSGRTAEGPNSFLGRYHQQISVLSEYRQRDFLGWLGPGLDLFSVKNIFLSSLFRGRQFNMTTSTNGEERAIIPSGNYERVMPLDIMPLFLMRALAVDDVEEAEGLGCLELDEEDLALCAFVCPSKLEFGPMLRRNLTRIEREG
jgi:Na+-transporting NADH:ubiquinone oxidoreductase subunit A